jgi:phosphatidate cytidylyltransferase
MSNHLLRLITATIATPLLIVVILFSSEIVFLIFILCIIQIGVWEYNSIIFGQKDYKEKGAVSFFALIIPLTFFIRGDSALAPMLLFCLLLTFLLYLWNIKSLSVDLARTGKMLVGLLYLPFSLSYFILLRNVQHGVWFVLFTIVMVCSGDISAYYIGRTFGKHKLHVLISPGKTVEGAIGQCMGSLIGSILFKSFIFTIMPMIGVIVVGIVGGVLASLGDLFESALKRSAGVKDSGILVPGHGGLMDRLDSLTFVVPFVFYYQHIVNV